MRFSFLTLSLPMAFPVLGAPVADPAPQAAVPAEGSYPNAYGTKHEFGNQGHCGRVRQTSEMVVAVSTDYVDVWAHPSVCGRFIHIENNGGKWGKGTEGSHGVDVEVVDTCGNCKPDHLDISWAAYRILNGGSLDPGEMNIRFNWTLVNA